MSYRRRVKFLEIALEGIDDDRDAIRHETAVLLEE